MSKEYVMQLEATIENLRRDNSELKAKAQKEHNSLNLLMQELDCKDFAELRKYARCGYERLKSQEKEVVE